MPNPPFDFTNIQVPGRMKWRIGPRANRKWNQIYLAIPEDGATTFRSIVATSGLKSGTASGILTYMVLAGVVVRLDVGYYKRGQP